MSEPVNILDYEGQWAGQGMDLSDTVLHVCPCGSELFRIVASFNDYEIASYSTDAECIECGTRCKAPTPVDDPEFHNKNNLSF